MITSAIEQRAMSLLGFARVQQDHANVLAKATGEHFNIFQILRIGHLEVGTHSPILAELLNPAGMHGQGSDFLRLFLSHFEISNFDAVTAKVDMEYHAGAVTEDSGGRIDILIRDSKGETILIENKIYAGDQERQMSRYRAFAKNAHLFYLTLDGKEPSNEANVEGLRCISYASDILTWLEECRKESVCIPTVRETITQYIHLIKDLTHQNTNTRMSENLSKAILQDAENYRAYIAIRNTEHELKSAIIVSLNKKLEELASELELELSVTMRGDAGKYDGFFFSNSGLKKNRVSIGFECDKGYYRDFYLGFRKFDETDSDFFYDHLANEFSGVFGENLSTKGWPAYIWWKKNRHWDDNTFEAIQFGNFIQDVRKDLTRLLSVFARAQAKSNQQSITLPTP